MRRPTYYSLLLLGIFAFAACKPEKEEPSLVDRFMNIVEEAEKDREEAKSKEYSLDKNGRISAADLVYAYDGNEIRADATFRDSIFTVVGKIEEIGRDAETDSPMVTFRGSGFNDFLLCYFEDGSALIHFNEGDKVRITGRCGGKDHYVEMFECTTIEAVP